MSARWPGPMAMWLVCATLTACGAEELESVAEAHELAAYPNPFNASSEGWAPQPRRERPKDIEVHADGQRAWVSLPGTVDRPGHHVAQVEVGSGKVLGRVRVGASPLGMALHPDGQVLVVCNRFSNHLSVIDTATAEVVHSPATDYYTVDAAFAAGGSELWLANRWRDAVAVWQVQRHGAGLRIVERLEPGVPVADNPHQLAVSADGAWVAAASMTAMTVSIIGRAQRQEVRRLDVGAPANGVAFAGGYLIVATLSRATHHLPFAGPDTDGDGQPGDGTPNVNFQDLQNELAVFQTGSGEELWRYTSDTMTGKDYRDVHPQDLARHGDLLPPAERRIVGGALPERVAVAPQDGGWQVWVTYSASNQIQRLHLAADIGALAAGPVWPAGGHNPHDIAVAGQRVVISHRLGETVAIVDRADGTLLSQPVVGDLTAGPFPATDAEIGELVNFVTAPFSVDGDQSCAHCHREDGNIDKAFSMPLTRYPGVGSRMTMAYRGMADTRPWFFESAMEEHNFKPVINEFARIENFCCTDYTLWTEGAPADCEQNPPPACATAPNPGSSDGFDATRQAAAMAYAGPRPTKAPSRNIWYQEQAKQWIGRSESFGDGLYFEDPITGTRQPVPLNFDGITRALGLFLMSAPRLLPNPNPAQSAAAQRGRALFEHAETGCATCHPAPTFAVSTDVNPANLPLRMGPVVSPNRAADGTNLDLLAGGFVATFPQAEMDSCEAVCGKAPCADDPDVCDHLRNVRLGVPSLRGLWDRARQLLHDGRAKGLREVLCTPGHPALSAGQRGFNESDGVIDTHGGTSHLTPRDVEDIEAYLRSL